MITLSYKGKNYAIVKAVKKANEILQSEAFYDRVTLLPQMLNTDLSSSEIASILRNTNQEIVIESFWNPFQGPTKITEPNLFKLNIYRLSCTTAFIVNSIINDAVLSVSLINEKLSFERTDFDDLEYPNIFPRRLGEVAEILTRKSRLATLQNQIS